MCHRLTRICSILVLLTFCIICHRIFDISNTKTVTCVTGSVYPPGAHKLNPGFQWDLYCYIVGLFVQCTIICLFVLFLLAIKYLLFFDLRLLITLFAPAFVSYLITHGKHPHDRWEVLACKTRLSLSRFYWSHCTKPGEWKRKWFP